MKLTFWGTLLIASIAIAQDSPATFADLSARAAAARDANEPKSAVILYKQALQLNSNWREGWWMAGSLQYETEQYTDCAESLRHLAGLTPGAGPAWAMLGLCEYETGNYGDALGHIRQGLAIGVGDQQQMILVLKFREALVLTKNGQFDAALRRYADFVPSEVRDDQVLLGLGLTNLRRAATPAEIPTDQRDLFLTAGRALAAQLTRDDAGAKSAYKELIGRFPVDPNAHYAYGYFLFGADADRAIQEWQRALSIDPSHTAAHAMLAWAFWLRDEKEKALTHAQAAAQDPELTVAQIVLGRLLVEAGRIDPGIETLERVVRIAPDNLEAHLALATAYSEAGRKLDCQRERQRCLKMRAEAGSLARP